MIFSHLITGLFDSPERKRCNMIKRIYNMRLGDTVECNRRSIHEFYRQQQEFYGG